MRIFPTAVGHPAPVRANAPGKPDWLTTGCGGRRPVPPRAFEGSGQAVAEAEHRTGALNQEPRDRKLSSHVGIGNRNEQTKNLVSLTRERRVCLSNVYGWIVNVDPGGGSVAGIIEELRPLQVPWLASVKFICRFSYPRSGT